MRGTISAAAAIAAKTTRVDRMEYCSPDSESILEILSALGILSALDDRAMLRLQAPHRGREDRPGWLSGTAPPLLLPGS